MFLGFDISTQQAKCLLIDDDLEVVYENAVQYDRDLPYYGTMYGVHIHSDQVTVTSPTLMWIEAIDLLLTKMKAEGFDFNGVKHICGAAQQHGTVFWKTGAEEKLINLQETRSLLDQLKSCFSIEHSPIWMDASAVQQCRHLENHLGGAQRLANVTGSAAVERMSGNLIAKVYHDHPDLYESCERISLVSSFVTSIFIGKYASLEFSDASGMNLLDINTKQWSEECLNACAPDLKRKLGQPVGFISDDIASYFVERYGFSPNCRVTSFTGDNPASVLGFALKEGDAVVSLGTSDCLMTVQSLAKPTLYGHFYISPIDRSQFMMLLCFKNGSKTREKICNEKAGGSWDVFSDLLQSTPIGNNGNAGFYFDIREIQPFVSGVYRFNSDGNLVSSFPEGTEVRALLESQFMLQRIYGEKLGFDLDKLSYLLVTGGASVNKSILQVLADIYGVPVYTNNSPNSAALGAALKARHQFIEESEGKSLSYFDTLKKLKSLTLVANPSEGSKKVYEDVFRRYKKLVEEFSS